jgi:hypothetical protein
MYTYQRVLYVRLRHMTVRYPLLQMLKAQAGASMAPSRAQLLILALDLLFASVASQSSEVTGCSGANCLLAVNNARPGIREVQH